jgi:two-component system response regulator HydG
MTSIVDPPVEPIVEHARQRVLATLLRWRARAVPVFSLVALSVILGESGTGKERVAEAIVRASTRTKRPYVRFNCAALPHELAEAELFGHARGAFTGAHRARAGLFREAHGGTLLLDEIAELDLRTRASCFASCRRARCGPSARTARCRWTCASWPPPTRTSSSGCATARFREDLYYRLKVVTLRVPPLRERPEDVETLFAHFLERYQARFGVGPLAVPDEVRHRIRAHRWPGNVRELENAVECLVALAVDGTLDPSLLPDPRRHVVPAALPEPVDGQGRGLRERLDAYERAILVQALEDFRGNRTEAARRLGIGRATLHEKLLEHGLAGAG